MKSDRRKQKQQERRRSRAKLIGGSIFAVAVLVFAVGSFVSPSKEPEAVESFRRIEAAELMSLVARGGVTVIDVRDIDSYLAGHIPGSLQIPLSRIDGEIPYLAKGTKIVTYCTCPAEESSGLAVQILAHGGIADAAALRGGLDAWRKSGGPIESGYPRR
jgi:rhodanese-related sulfurtransferase